MINKLLYFPRSSAKVMIFVAFALLISLPVILFSSQLQQQTNSHAAGTSLSFTIFLHGIGKGGDSANAASGGNADPFSKQRNISIIVSNSQNQVVATKDVTVSYNATNGNFTGNVDLGTVPSGAYTISVKAERYLRRSLPGIQNLTAGQANQAAPIYLTAGDIDGNNQVNILDFNVLMGCYSDLSVAKSCTAQQQTFADLTDDGSVNQVDYNLFIREVSNLSGSGGENPTIIPTTVATINPTITNTPTSLQPSGGPGGTWKIVFDDEFNGSALNTANWAPYWFSNGGNMNDVATDQSNVSVSGGYLLLTLSSAGHGALVSSNPNGGASKGFTFTTGYAEAKILFPGSGATIYNWPAWWTDGQSWPANGEIDIAEGLDTLTTNYHSSSGANNSGTIAGTWAAGYHTYAVDRQNGKINVYWDGKLVRAVNTNDGNAPHYLILNVGAGSKAVYGAGSQVKVDYVRVWQK